MLHSHLNRKLGNITAPSEPREHENTRGLSLERIFYLFIFCVSQVLILFLPTPHFSAATPGLDFQMFKTLITASSSKESSQHDSHQSRKLRGPSVFLGYRLQGEAPRMKRRALQKAIRGPLANCCVVT